MVDEVVADGWWCLVMVLNGDFWWQLLLTTSVWKSPISTLRTSASKLGEHNGHWWLQTWGTVRSIWYFWWRGPCVGKPSPSVVISQFLCWKPVLDWGTMGYDEAKGVFSRINTRKYLELRVLPWLRSVGMVAPLAPNPTAIVFSSSFMVSSWAESVSNFECQPFSSTLSHYSNYHIRESESLLSILNHW